MTRHPYYEIELEDTDGNVYPLMFPDRLLREISGLGMPPLKHWSTRAPYQVGETHWGYAVKPRIINCVLYARGCDRSDMYAKSRAIVEMLNPRSGPHKVRLVTPAPDPRKMELHRVYVTGGFDLSSADQPSPNTLVTAGQLTAYDPIWKWTNAPLNAGETRDADGRSCMVENAFVAENELVLPFTGPFLLGTTTSTATITAVNSGTWSVKPVITMEGPVDDWYLDNTTTGKILYWDGYSIDTGEIVTLNIPEKTVTNAAGDILNNYVSGDFGTFYLDVGTNTIDFWASSGVGVGTEVGVCWYLEVLGA